MKKSIWLFSLLLVSLLSCSSESNNTDVQSHNLTGKVKVLKESIEGKKRTMLKAEYHFNESGIYTEILNFGIKGNVKSRVEFTLDNSGNKINRHVYNRKDSLMQTWNISYDENGNKSKVEGLNNNNVVEITNLMSYNDENLVDEHKIILKDGKMKNHVRYLYDQNGNEVEKHVIGKKGKVFKRFKRSFQNNLKIKEETFNNKDSLISTQDFEYDQFKNPIKITTKARKISVVTKVYEYDDKGNWTKCTNFVNDNKKKTLIREIEYHQ